MYVGSSSRENPEMASSIKVCQNVQRTPDQISSAGDCIGGNKDLIVEILQRLPAKPLIRFKSVCKTWFALICSHRFSLLWQLQQQQSHDPKVSGIFLTIRFPTEIKYIPLIDGNDNGDCDCDGDGDGECESLIEFPDFPDFSGCGNGFYDYGSYKPIVDSCNGFLLIVSKEHLAYYVYNPTTKLFSTVPWPFLHSSTLYLVFDPFKSLHYKVVCFHKHKAGNGNDDDLYQLHIYSSQTNAWTPSGNPFLAQIKLDADCGLYCNGCIHFLFYGKEASFYFDLDQERLCPMPSPPIPDHKFHHFGESRGHLHLVEGDSGLSFNFFELERDYSSWSFKYSVDLQTKPMKNIRGFIVLSFIDGGDEQGSSLLLYLRCSHLIISYNIKDHTLKKLGHVINYPWSFCTELSMYFFVHRHIETLFSVCPI